MAMVPDLSGNGVQPERHHASKAEAIGPFTRMLAVTPSDTVDLVNEYGVTEPARGLVIGVAGNLAYIPAQSVSNASVTVAAPAGVFPVQVRRVLATGTTASSIFAGR